jgi:hypothetical protein
MSPIKLNYKNELRTIAEWCKELELIKSTVYRRISLGWPPELVLSKLCFSYCNAKQAAHKLSGSINSSNPSSTRVDSNNLFMQDTCSDELRVCPFAISLTQKQYTDRNVKGIPNNTTYYCKYVDDFIISNKPKCGGRNL